MVSQNSLLQVLHLYQRRESEKNGLLAKLLDPKPA